MAFFEQLGKCLTDAGQNVAQQTKNLADVTQLSNAISEKEKKIPQLLLNIGQLYYEDHKDDLSAEYQEVIGNINDLYAEIAQNREKIKQIKGVVKCPKCGADVPPNAAFCNACGEKMEHTDVLNKVNRAQRHCPVCHAVVSAEDSFCNKCGAKVD